MQIMTHCVEEAKAQLRRQCLQRRTELRAEAVTRASAAIASRVAALDIWTRSGSVHSYVDSMAGEVQTEGLIRIALAQGSQLVAPPQQGEFRVYVDVDKAGADNLSPDVD